MTTKGPHNAWVSPTGRVFEVYGFAKHNEWAEKFLEDKWLKSGRLKNAWELHDEIDKEAGWSSYPYEVLEKWGWVRVLDWETSSGVQFIYDKKPNKRQLRALFDFCTERKIPLPKELF